MENTKMFIDSIVSGNKETTDTIFSDLIRNKVRNVLEIKKVELAATIYSGEESVKD